MEKVTLVPMLRVQRALCDLPRGGERFRRYLDAMTGGTDDIVLPLSLFNPMGKDHVATTLDRLLGIDAEGVATEALAEATDRLDGVDAEFRVGLVVADDAGGGWPNRYYTEIGNRFRPGNELRRGWAVSLLWTSEVASRERVRREVLATVYRTAYVLRHGQPVTLSQMMRQEGLAASFAGVREPALDADDLAYSREVIGRHLDSSDPPDVFACLYGDAAARSAGYTPLGLSHRAGYAVALDEARERAAGQEVAVRAVAAEGTPVSRP